MGKNHQLSLTIHRLQTDAKDKTAVFHHSSVQLGSQLSDLHEILQDHLTGLKKLTAPKMNLLTQKLTFFACTGPIQYIYAISFQLPNSQDQLPCFCTIIISLPSHYAPCVQLEKKGVDLKYICQVWSGLTNFMPFYMH